MSATRTTEQDLIVLTDNGQIARGKLDVRGLSHSLNFKLLTQPRKNTFASQAKDES